MGGGGGAVGGGQGGSAAAGRSGSAGAGGSTMEPGAGSSGANCPTGAILCDGFEAYAADAAPGGMWKASVRGGGQIQVASAKTFAGTRALHVTGMVASDAANIQRPLAITAPTVFVRFMMYTTSYPSSSGVHTRLFRMGTMAGTDAGTPEQSYALSSYNGTAIEKVNSIYLRNTATHFNDDSLKNRWVCWELEVDKTGGVGKVTPHIWVDGRELSFASAGSSSHGMTSPSWDPIPIETVILGLFGYQADAVRADFWIDELAINSARIGCPKAS